MASPSLGSQWGGFPGFNGPETIIQPFILWIMSTEGRFTIPVPTRVLETYQADANTTKWTVEVTSFAWMVSGIKLDETANPTNTNSSQLERDWTARVFEVTRALGFGLIMTGVRNTGSRSFNVIPLVGAETTVSNVAVSPTLATKVDCLGYCPMGVQSVSARLGGSVDFRDWQSAGPMLLQYVAGKTEAGFRVMLCRGFSNNYPTETTNGIFMGQESSGSYRPAYPIVEGGTSINLSCSPMFMMVKYVRQVPQAMRPLL